MEGLSVERRLAAILVSDMVGYSRLMEFDEEGTFARQKAHRRELIDPTIGGHNGHIIKSTGDGLLVEFASVSDAVQCAVAIQTAMIDREALEPEASRIQYRIGINLGDIIFDEGDIFGDGVNIAARLQEIAEPCGICMSDIVYQSVTNKFDLPCRDIGSQRIKNISKPIHVWQWCRAGKALDDIPERAPGALEQKISFCAAPDGTTIAYAVVGKGPPIVKAPNWMNHLEYDWQSPIWRHLLTNLASDHTLVRFDQRGNGLSDWDVEDISHDAYDMDLEAVIDASGLERFMLLGVSQGCAISIRYAVRHPERVKGMVLYGGYARGKNKRGSADMAAQAEAERTLIRQGWGQDNPAFRQLFTSAFLPDGTPEQMAWFNELQRVTVSPENAFRIRMVNDYMDITQYLPKVSVPTLVLHCRDDAVAPFEEGRRIAAMIPDAQFVALEGRNHLILENEPAWPRFIEEVRDFLATVED